MKSLFSKFAIVVLISTNVALANSAFENACLDFSAAYQNTTYNGRLTNEECIIRKQIRDNANSEAIGIVLDDIANSCNGRMRIQTTYTDIVPVQEGDPRRQLSLIVKCYL